LREAIQQLAFIGRQDDGYASVHDLLLGNKKLPVSWGA
jgi:hypothetical protein